MTQFSIAADQVPDALAMGGDLRPRMKGDQPKCAPNGKPTFSSGVVVAREDGGVDRGATISVIEPPAAPWLLGTPLRAAGACWVTPYVTDANRQGLSYTVERLVPVSAGKAGD